jgi:hypothetical protein
MPWMLQGNKENVFHTGFLQFIYQSHAGHIPSAALLLCTLAFCPFKWYHRIPYLHVPWRFPLQPFLVYLRHWLQRVAPWLLGIWGSKWGSRLEQWQPPQLPKKAGLFFWDVPPKQPSPVSGFGNQTTYQSLLCLEQKRPKTVLICKV